MIYLAMVISTWATTRVKVKSSNKYSTSVFWLLEINLLLWLVILGYFIKPQQVVDNTFSFNTTIYIVIAGCVLSAYLQHWAYYKIYKPNKAAQKSKKTHNSAFKRDAEKRHVP